jgi:hypothetical protein
MQEADEEDGWCGHTIRSKRVGILRATAAFRRWQLKVVTHACPDTYRYASPHMDPANIYVQAFVVGTPHLHGTQGNEERGLFHRQLLHKLFVADANGPVEPQTQTKARPKSRERKQR